MVIESLESFKKQYYEKIAKGEDVAADIKEINESNISDTDKQEIRAEGFVHAFNEMKGSKDSQEFMKHYSNVQKMSEGGIPSRVENPKLNTQLEYANNVTQSFNERYMPDDTNNIGKFAEVIEQKQKLMDEQEATVLKFESVTQQKKNAPEIISTKQKGGKKCQN